MQLIFTLPEIDNAAQQFLNIAENFTVFAFTGNLGSGKTTFIQAVCKKLGVTETTSSPTYSIIQEYKDVTGKIIYHIDLYRLKDEQEAIDAGVEECIYSGHKCFIEWPDKATILLPADTVKVFIEAIDDQKRKMVIKIPG